MAAAFRSFHFLGMASINELVRNPESTLSARPAISVVVCSLCVCMYAGAAVLQEGTLGIRCNGPSDGTL